MGKPTDLDAVQKLCDAATPGPWERNVDIEEWARQQRHYQGDSIVSGPARTSIATDVQDPPDVRFICSARTLVPQMAAEIRDLRAELAAERARTDALVAALPKCDECDAPTTENEFGYDGRVTYWCDDHGPFCDATPWDVALRAITYARRLAAGGEESGK